MKLYAPALGLALAVVSAPVSASVVVLDFKGVANPSNSTTIGGFYNGGTSGDGNSGVNYGVAFSNNALAINSYNGTNEPDPGILFFLSGGAVTSWTMRRASQPASRSATPPTAAPSSPSMTVWAPPATCWRCCRSPTTSGPVAGNCQWERHWRSHSPEPPSRSTSAAARISSCSMIPVTLRQRHRGWCRSGAFCWALLIFGFARGRRGHAPPEGIA